MTHLLTLAKRLSRLTFSVVVVAIVVATLFVLSSLSTAAAGRATGGLSSDASLRVLQPTPGEVVTTPGLTLDVRAVDYMLDAGYAGTPNLSHIGHYHEILDGRLVDMTPLHNPNTDIVSMVDVTPGPHVLTLVPANNDHSMVMSAAVSIPFTYAGPFLPPPAPVVFPNPPAIAITSPANGTTIAGRSFFMTASIGDFSLCGDCFGKDNITGVGHWHIFLDQPVMSHMLTMAGGTTQEVSLKAIPQGWHTFYAVLVNDQHMPFMAMPSTMTSIRLYVAGSD